jgi:hypothetical protein
VCSLVFLIYSINFWFVMITLSVIMSQHNLYWFSDFGLVGCDTMYSCRWFPMFQRNTDNHLQDYTVSQSMTPQSVLSQLWKPPYLICTDFLCFRQIPVVSTLITQYYHHHHHTTIIIIVVVVVVVVMRNITVINCTKFYPTFVCQG